MRKKVFIVLGAILLAALGVFFFFLPGYVGRRMNATIEGPPYAASERAKALHKNLLVADLHADTLMWDRDLLKRGDWGHVDLPRLVEGNVAVQAFTVVTKTPRGMNIESNSGDTDNITPLALAERWPVTSWWNLTERALYQARRLHEASARSNGKLVILRTRQDVTNFLERRKTDTEIVGGFLGLEGAHALEGDVNNLDRLYDAGFRMIGMAHFFDNEMAGSAHGVDKYGLTDKGRDLVWRMEEKRVFIDLAHASPKTIDEVLRIAAQPVIVSHTGVKGTCDNTRNLSDGQLKAIANNGGIVGIGFWDTAVCGGDAAAIAKAIRYTANIMGIDHVALGSDYDGAVKAPFDATGVVQITDALLREGFNEDEIRKIMGENVIRMLQSYLP
ncbi:MAG TPA: dipeptidase [Blastocatellia bacterium]|jgi:microsomal dipeptidase-like Zn-dependent dipeptidase|nr:dipeptidase [Blastocatellia bacterium]